MDLGLSSALIYSLENWHRQVDVHRPRVCDLSHLGSNLLNFDPLSSSLQPTRQNPGAQESLKERLPNMSPITNVPAVGFQCFIKLHVRTF